MELAAWVRLFDTGHNRFLAEQGVAWAALRHGFYASTLEIYLPDALETGGLRLPRTGRSRGPRTATSPRWTRSR